MRGDETTRYANYRTALEGGWLTVAAIRQRENLPALPAEATPPSVSTNWARSHQHPDGADHVVVSEALARVLRRWGVDHFSRATSAEDVRRRLAPAQHVPGRVMKLVDNVWPVRAGSLAAELIREGKEHER